MFPKSSVETANYGVEKAKQEEKKAEYATDVARMVNPMATTGERFQAAADAVGDKFGEAKHATSAEIHRQKAAQ
jgi:hypothetical protein